MIFSSKIAPSDIFERAAEIQWKRIEDKAVIVDRMEGELVHFNEIGTLIWEKLTGQNSLYEITSELTREIDAPRQVLEKDVMKFVRELSRMELVRKKSKAL